VHNPWTLKWLRHNTHLQATTPAEPDWLPTEFPDEFPAIAAVCSHTHVLCSAAVSQKAADFWITTPVVLTEPQEPLLTFLLQHLLDLLAPARSKRVMLLAEPYPCAAPLQRSLITAGFQELAQIARFQQTSAAIDCPPKTDHHAATEASPRIVRLRINDTPRIQQNATALTHLISMAATQSADLVRLPPPTASQLLQEWQQADAELLIAVDQHGLFLGLCVLAYTADQPAAADCEQQLLWLAIRPENRRRGIATFLLQTALQTTNRLPAGDQHGPLSACVDLHNTAAVQLYRKCGFQQTDHGFGLWSN